MVAIVVNRELCDSSSAEKVPAIGLGSWSSYEQFVISRCANAFDTKLCHFLSCSTLKTCPARSDRKIVEPPDPHSKTLLLRLRNALANWPLHKVSKVLIHPLGMDQGETMKTTLGGISKTWGHRRVGKEDTKDQTAARGIQQLAASPGESSSYPSRDTTIEGMMRRETTEKPVGTKGYHCRLCENLIERS